MNTTSNASNHPVNNRSLAEASSPAAEGGDFLLLGFKDFEDLNGVDLLKFVTEHSATLNFPQKLMLMLTHVDRELGKSMAKSPISWAPDGQCFVINSRAEFSSTLLPLFFRESTKFSSFTRKLYRWGFRQICIPKGHNRKERDMVFGHEHFKRDEKSLMAHMRSVTAAGTRRAIAALNKRKKENDAKKAAASREEAAAVPLHVVKPETPPSATIFTQKMSLAGKLTTTTSNPALSLAGLLNRPAPTTAADTTASVLGARTSLLSQTPLQLLAAQQQIQTLQMQASLQTLAAASYLNPNAASLLAARAAPPQPKPPTLADLQNLLNGGAASATPPSASAIVDLLRRLR